MAKTMTTMVIGQVTASNPATRIFSGTFDSVTLKAPSTNTVTVWIVSSASGTDATGFPLEPGEYINADQYATGTIYAYAASGSPKLCYVGGQ